MNHLFLDTKFYDNNNPSQKDSYTLCAKNDIPPACVLSFDMFHPIYTDSLIPRAPQYNHPANIYGFGLPLISYPDNAWAWVYNSNKKNVQLPYPCFYDILALNHSNSIAALASLIRIIAQERLNDVQAENCQKSIEAECNGSTFVPTQVNVTCELPETIKLRARFKYNNEWFALYIFAQFSNKSTNIVNFIIRPFNPNATQVVTPKINTCIGANILEAISNIVHTTQQQLKVKIYFDMMDCGTLIPQPVL